MMPGEGDEMFRFKVFAFLFNRQLVRLAWIILALLLATLTGGAPNDAGG